MWREEKWKGAVQEQAFQMMENFSVQTGSQTHIIPSENLFIHLYGTGPITHTCHVYKETVWWLWWWECSRGIDWRSRWQVQTDASGHWFQNVSGGIQGTRGSTVTTPSLGVKLHRSLLSPGLCNSPSHYYSLHHHHTSWGRFCKRSCSKGRGGIPIFQLPARRMTGT